MANLISTLNASTCSLVKEGMKAAALVAANASLWLETAAAAAVYCRQEACGNLSEENLILLNKIIKECGGEEISVKDNSKEEEVNK